MTGGLLAAGLVSGLVMAPASAAGATSDAAGNGAISTQAQVVAKATVRAKMQLSAGSKSKKKGSARLVIGAWDESDYMENSTLVREKATGVLLRRGRVVRRLAIRTDTDDKATVLRRLAPGRYRVRLDRIHAQTTVPGGRVPSHALQAPERLKPLRVRANRTTTWRADYTFDNYSLVVSGTVVDRAMLRTCGRVPRPGDVKERTFPGMICTTVKF